MRGELSAGFGGKEENVVLRRVGDREVGAFHCRGWIYDVGK